MTLQEIWNSIGEFFKSIWTYFFGKKEEQFSSVHQIPEGLEDIPIKLGETTQETNDVVNILPETKIVPKPSENETVSLVGNSSSNTQKAGMGAQLTAWVTSKLVPKENVKIVAETVSSGIEKIVLKPLFALDAVLEGIEAKHLYQQGDLQQGDTRAFSALTWGAATFCTPFVAPAIAATLVNVGTNVGNEAQRQRFMNENASLEEERRNLRGAFLEQCQRDQKEKQLAIEWGLWDEEKERESHKNTPYAHTKLPDEIRSQVYGVLNQYEVAGLPPEQWIMNVETKQERLLSFWNYQEIVRNADIDLENEAKRIQDSAYADPNRWWNKTFVWRSSVEAFNNANKDPRDMSPEEQDALALQKREFDVAVMLGIRENVIPPEGMELKPEERLKLYEQLNLIQGDKISSADEEKFKCLETIPRDQIQITLRIKDFSAECEKQAKEVLIEKHTTYENYTTTVSGQGVGVNTTQTNVVKHEPKPEDLDPKEVQILAEDIKLQMVVDSLGFKPEELLMYFKEKQKELLNKFPEEEQDAWVKKVLFETAEIIRKPTGEIITKPPFETIFPKLQQRVQQWEPYKKEQEETDNKFKNSRIQNPILLSKDQTPVYIGVDTHRVDEGVILLPSDQAHYKNKELTWDGGMVKLKEGFLKKPYLLSCNGITYQVVEMTDIVEMRLGDKKISPSYKKIKNPKDKSEKTFYNLGTENEMFSISDVDDVPNRVSALNYLRSSTSSESQITPLKTSHGTQDVSTGTKALQNIQSPPGVRGTSQTMERK